MGLRSWEEIYLETFEESLADKTDNQAYLLFEGTRAENLLKQLHDRAESKKYAAVWINDVENEADFWLKLHSQLYEKIPDETLLRWIEKEKIEKFLNDGCGSFISDISVGVILDKGEKFCLFLPNLEYLFYKTDVEQKSNLNAKLRSMWTAHGEFLTIAASVSDSKSEQFEKTLNNYHFPFYADNFRQCHLNR
jgi:hypothetical protein